MEKFNLAQYIKDNYRADYPFEGNGGLALNTQKLEHLLNEIHAHYEGQAPKEEVEYNGPELVTEEYAFQKIEEAEVKELHQGMDKLKVIIRNISQQIGSKKYILAYEDDDGKHLWQNG